MPQTRITHIDNYYLLRDDLIHPQVSGNKWRKLQGFISQAKASNLNAIVTFGGAFSNHIHATAAWGHLNDWPTIGYIRGEAANHTNPTLTDALTWGMELHFLDRQTYRQKDSEAFQAALRQTHPQSILIPEGGYHRLGTIGCRQIIADTQKYMQASANIDISDRPTYYVVACGTGTTLAGMAAELAHRSWEHHHIIGIPVLKGGFMPNQVKSLFTTMNLTYPDSLITFMDNFHWGGYAKWNKTLLSFMDKFAARHHIQLDQVYTGKMIYALEKLLSEQYFPKDSLIIGIHTGGLQGVRGLKTVLSN